MMKNGNKKLLFCLPGNPVSALVTFHVFVVPCLRMLAGERPSEHVTRKAKVVLRLLGSSLLLSARLITLQLLEDVALDSRPEYRRARVGVAADGVLTAECSPLGGQQSSRILSMVGANALLCLPRKTESLSGFASGSMVDIIFLGRL